jgi:hypothetical protein
MSIDRRKLLALAAAAAAAGAPPRSAAVAATSDSDDPVAETLRSRTQEMLDAIAPGRKEVWERYLHRDVVFTSEDGEVFDRTRFLAEMKPLPAGVGGSIRAIDFSARSLGNVAIATYVSDEDESYHGQKLHCQYRTTDSWLKTGDGWRLVASQTIALRADPPAVELPASLVSDYPGRYALTPDIEFEIRRKGDGLEGQQTGRPAKALRAEAPDVMFVPGSPRYRYIFQRDAAGRVKGFAQRREAWDVVWTRKK